MRRALEKRAMRETEGRVKRLFFGFASVEEGTKREEEEDPMLFLILRH